jgi:uncharacterized C2H2 Zn-finger protein
MQMGLFKKKNDTKENKTRTFKCKRCDMIFDDNDRLKRHDKKAHFGKKTSRKKEV